MDMNFDEAQALANQYLLDQDFDVELALLDDKTLEKEFGWIFFYTTKRYLETGDFRDMVGGNAPFIIDKETRVLTETGTAHDIDYYVEEYRSSRK